MHPTILFGNNTTTVSVEKYKTYMPTFVCEQVC